MYSTGSGSKVLPTRWRLRSTSSCTRRVSAGAPHQTCRQTRRAFQFHVQNVFLALRTFLCVSRPDLHVQRASWPSVEACAAHVAFVHSTRNVSEATHHCNHTHSLTVHQGTCEQAYDPSSSGTVQFSAHVKRTILRSSIRLKKCRHRASVPRLRCARRTR